MYVATNKLVTWVISLATMNTKLQCLRCSIHWCCLLWFPIAVYLFTWFAKKL